jgi:hypothetical protein
MLSKFRLIVGVLVIPEVFFEANAEWSSGLTNVLHITIRTSQLVYATFFILILFLILVWFKGKGLANSVICGEGDFN